MMQNKSFAVTQAVLGLVCQILGLMLASHCWVRNGHWHSHAGSDNGGAAAAAPGLVSLTPDRAAGAAGQPRRRRRPDSGSVIWATPEPGPLYSKSED